ncbi:MAG: hypothetical protein HQ567_00585, partial [Candidatus Nealsonbacteria bacterium]|nr:hypothetical protein [Candidatus Nealsonbacteria bacterium]
GGTILWEYWTDINGTAVSDLTSDPDYPDNPDGQEYYTLFESPTDWANYYGGRMYGYLYPYLTGNHKFWIATDDNGELWLSTDETPENKVRIAHVPGWAGSRNWTKYGEQKSASIYLEAGRRYYIEALMKEGGGGDNLAVGWEPPGVNFDGTPIPGSYLSPYQEVLDPLSVNVTAGATETPDSTPALGGTVDDASVAVTVQLDGRYYAAINHGDGTWTLPDDAVDPPLAVGTHEITVCASDAAGRTAFDATTGELVVSAPAVQVVARHVFYNHSFFDGNDPAGNTADNGAVAPDKTALLPGAVAEKANYTSYARGINGVMVDIAGLPEGVTPDFRFHTGNSDTPDDWPLLDAVATIAVHEGAGVDGSDRVAITFADNAIHNTWLQVTVGPTAQCPLPTADVFYFGNAVSEAGDSTADARVTTTDLLLARNNPRDLISGPAAITLPYDFDRDGHVNATDVLLARNNQTNFLSALRLIDLSAVAEGSYRRQTVEDAAFSADHALASVATAAWLTDLDRSATQHASQKDAAAQAVDTLLAMYWAY